LRIHTIGEEKLILIFFKDSKHEYYQEHIDFMTGSSFGNYKVGKKGWKIRDVYLLEHDVIQ